MISGGAFAAPFDIQINPGPTLAGNAPALAAFNRAAAQWEAYITDPVTVFIDADLVNITNPNIIGSTGSTIYEGSYGEVRDALIADAADEPDDAITNSLPTTIAFDMPVGFGLRGATNPNEAIQLTAANVRALGQAIPSSPADATINFNQNFSFDYDPLDTNLIGSGLVDFETVAAHEIGHALGFISSVDDVDFFQALHLTSQSIQPAPLDLFRFANGSATDPATDADFASSAFHRSLVPGVDAVFDQVLPEYGNIENRMSTGVFFGDGRQASHWKDNNLTGTLIGVMDPTLANQQVFSITADDLRVLDLIGWDVAAIPEAQAWMFAGVASCASGAGWWAKRRGRAAA